MGPLDVSSGTHAKLGLTYQLTERHRSMPSRERNFALRNDVNTKSDEDTDLSVSLMVAFRKGREALSSKSGRRSVPICLSISS